MIPRRAPLPKVPLPAQLRRTPRRCTRSCLEPERTWTMADGAKLNPDDANAASKTLPPGTTAMVTNLETGKSAIVTIEDRRHP
jgi:hypothetical protein